MTKIVAIILSWNAETGEVRVEIPLITGPKVESVKYLDISKAQRVLGWQPKLDLHDDLRETVRWYRNNS